MLLLYEPLGEECKRLLEAIVQIYLRPPTEHAPRFRDAHRRALLLAGPRRRERHRDIRVRTVLQRLRERDDRRFDLRPNVEATLIEPSRRRKIARRGGDVGPRHVLHED